MTGLLIDYLGAFHHANAAVSAMLPALAGSPWADVGSFHHSCPGGVGMVAGTGADTACRTAVQLATRQAILLAYGVGLWAALHYLIAAIRLRKGMPSIAADPARQDNLGNDGRTEEQSSI